MIKILFVCHGNICRSPMAEFICKKLVEDKGLEGFYIESAATSTEEIGNDIHRETQKILKENKIPFTNHKSVRLQKTDYEKYDYLIGMDARNIQNILKMTKGDSQKKISRLMDFTDQKKDIEDPWYTGDFDKTYQDIKNGCEYFLTKIK